MYVIRNLLRRWRGEAPADSLPDASPGSPSDSSPASSVLEPEEQTDHASEYSPSIFKAKPYYYPSPRDILHVSALLASTPLPNELIDPILELAEYWAFIRTKIEHTIETPIPKAIGRSREHVLLFRTKPLCSGAAEEGWHSGLESDADAGVLSDSHSGSRAHHYASLPDHLLPEPRSQHPARRITWRIRSQDQGWGGEGGDTYENSWTGFWGSVSRYRVPVLPTWGSESTNAEQDEDTASRTCNSSEYLAAWKALHEKPTAEPQPDVNRGVFVEGDTDEDRVWPRSDWVFEGARIQVNARAYHQPREHVVVWDHRDDIDAEDPRALELLTKKGRGLQTGAGVQVRALQRGDVVMLNSYAYFPGWSNTVENAEVIIEFAL